MNLIKSFFKFILSFPKSILCFCILLAIILGYFSTKLQIDASSQSLLLDNDKDFKTWQEISKRYKTPDFLVVAYTPDSGLLDKKSLDNIKKVSSEFEKLDFVDSVVNILNVPLFENKKLGLQDLLKDIPTLESKNVDLTAAKNEFLHSPLYESNLVSKDFKTTAIIINLKQHDKYNDFFQKRSLLIQKESNKTISSDELKTLEKLNSNLQKIKDEKREYDSKNIAKLRDVIKINSNDGSMFLGGVNLIANDMVAFVKNDIVFYGISSAILLMFCLWLFFRQIRFIFLPIFICVLSAIYASGLFGFFGFDITVISSNYLALQMIITMSVVIHLIVAYREKLRLKPNLSQIKIIYLSLIDRTVPCFFAILTTVIGFCSLIFCDIKPVIMLGIMMSVGISISLIVAFVIFACVMTLLDKHKISTTFEEHFSLTIWCAKMAINHRNIVYCVFLAMLCVGLFGISKIKVENSFIGYFKQNTEIYKGMEAIDQKLGGTVPFDVVIKFKKNVDTKEDGDDFEAEFNEISKEDKYWLNTNKANIIAKVHNFLKEQKFVGNVSSLDTILEVAKTINGGVALDDFMLSVIYSEIPQKYKKMIIDPYMDIKNNEAHFVVRTIDSDKNLARNKFLKDIKKNLNELLKDDVESVEVSGIMVLYNNMLQSLFSSQIATLGFVVIVLLIMFIFIFRSLKFAIIAILANVIPLTLVFGIMGIAKIPLDIMTITIAAISIGIGVDDAIHYIYRFKLERHRYNVKDAVMASHKSIGYAMYYTSFSIILGFCVMCISNFWPTIYFGMLIDIVMILLLSGALLLLPTMIISFFDKK